MKAKSRKNRLVQCYARVLKETHAPAEPNIFGSVIQNLFKKIDPLPELTEDNLDIVTEKRPRGRPRKLRNNKDGKLTHKIEFDPSECKVLDPTVTMKMVNDFRFHYRVNDIPLERSLERICKSYHISYTQAHKVLAAEF